MPVLTFTNGPRRGEVFHFERGIILGRGPLADVEVRDPAVSRRHAQITWGDDECFLSDLQSGNGTYVNNRRVEGPTKLSDGDEVRLGSSCLEYKSGVGKQRDSAMVSSVRFRESMDPLARSVVLSLSVKSREIVGAKSLAARSTALEQRLDFLTEVGQALGQTIEELPLLSRIVKKVLEIFPQAERAFIVAWDADKGEFSPRVARTRTGEASEIPASRTLLREVVEKKQAILSADAAEDPRLGQIGTVRDLNIRTVICAPLVAGDDVLGVLQIDSLKKVQPFGESDLGLVVSVANAIALSLANAHLHNQLLERRILEHDLALARKLQQRFLPKSLPNVAGYSFAVEYSPAEQIGGDLYDAFLLADGRVAVVLGDVSGKGVSGALVMSKLMSDLRHVGARRAEPARVLVEVNDLVVAEGGAEGMFITLVLAALDPKTGRIDLANAGHLKPILRRANGEVSELQVGSGAPLGVSKLVSVPGLSITLAPGDTMALFSDGLTEAANASGEQFGSERVAAALRQANPDPIFQLARVLESVRSFLGAQPFADDLTLLCLARASG